MIKRLLAAALCLLAVGSTFAQLRVELNFEQETYLPEEPMNAIVRIYNSSGQTLVLGTNTDWLTFSVESADGKVVKQKKTADVLGEFGDFRLTHVFADGDELHLGRDDALARVPELSDRMTGAGTKWLS